MPLISPDFGSDGQHFVELLQRTLLLAEIVRKEYLGHETAIKMAGTTKTIRGERIRAILDLAVQLQSYLMKKIELLAPVYQVCSDPLLLASLERQL